MEYLIDINNTDENYLYDLKLHSPMPIQGGSYLAKLTLNDNPILFQMPKCSTKKGIVSSGKRFYCDLLFKYDDSNVFDVIEMLENIIREKVFEKSELWFQDPPSIEDIEYNWNESIKQTKQNFCLRTYIGNSKNVKTNISVYNSNQEQISLEDITHTSNIISIIEVTGLKFSSSSFHINYCLRQVMVLEDVPIFNKCLINVSKPSQVGKSLSINDNHKETLEDESPHEDAAQEDTPTEDTQHEDTPTEDAPQEDTPTEDTPHEDTPTEDTQHEDTPTEHTLDYNSNKDADTDNLEKSQHLETNKNNTSENKQQEPDLNTSTTTDNLFTSENNLVDEPDNLTKPNNEKGEIHDNENNDLEILNNHNTNLEETDKSFDLSNENSIDLEDTNSITSDKSETSEIKSVVEPEKNTMEALENMDKDIDKNKELNTLEIKEVDIDIPDEEDAVLLKKPDTVYLDIYNKALEKAKDARLKAIQAYLELKQIKNKYMIEEIDEDDSDLYEELEL